MQIKLRDYQEECLAALEAGRKKGEQRQLVALPTGSGKTIVAAADMQRVVTTHLGGALFMAHRDELINQAAEKTRFVWADADIGRVKAADNELGHRITVASVQTIQRDKRLEQIVEAGPYSILYIDEAHHAAADTYVKIIERLSEANPDMLIVGLTATPVRADATKMSTVFSDVTFQKSMLDLIEAGYLADIALKVVDLDVSIDGIRKSHGDLKPSDVRKVLCEPSIMASMVDSWKNEAGNRRTLAFAVDVEHARQLSQMFESRGVSAEFIHGEMPLEERRRILSRFQAGKFSVLVNCMILTEGFDDISTGDRPLECVCLCRPTLSQSLYIQQVGRGTRPAPGKDNLLVLDFAYNSERHHLVQLPHLFGLEALPALKAKPKEEEDDPEVKELPSIIAAIREARAVDVKQPPPRAGFRWAKCEHGFALSLGAEHGFILIRPHDEDERSYHVWHFEPQFDDSQEDLDDSKRKKWADDYIEHQLTTDPMPFEWAFGLAEDATRELHEARSQGRTMKKSKFLDREAEWLALPPTEAQLRVLRRAKQQPTTRGEATDMITAMIVERIIRGRAPATAKQLGYLRYHKLDIPSRCTKQQASRLISEHKARGEQSPDSVGYGARMDARTQATREERQKKVDEKRKKNDRLVRSGEAQTPEDLFAHLKREERGDR
jgi:superfamily II DNA or RNA helicase